MVGERCADDSGACDDDGRASGHRSTCSEWGWCECIIRQTSFQRLRAACNLRNQFNDIETPAVGSH